MVPYQTVNTTTNNTPLAKLSENQPTLGAGGFALVHDQVHPGDPPRRPSRHHPDAGAGQLRGQRARLRRRVRRVRGRGYQRPPRARESGPLWSGRRRGLSQIGGLCRFDAPERCPYWGWMPDWFGRRVLAVRLCVGCCCMDVEVRRRFVVVIGF